MLINTICNSIKEVKEKVAEIEVKRGMKQDKIKDLQNQTMR